MTRALVLRAAEDALRTAENLRARGVEAVISPVLELVATEAEIAPGDYDAILVTSAKGVECARDAAFLGAIPVHAVGAKTARAAQARGWRTGLVAGNAQAMLPLLAARHAGAASFLYLAGRDRQPTLENGLRAGGHRVHVIEVYEARAATALTPAAIDALSAGAIDVVLHYSRRSARIFLARARNAGLSAAVTRPAHFALSADVAAPLAATGAADIRIAPTPDEAGLLSLFGGA